MKTLYEARKALLQLVETLPAESTYAAHLAVLSDYFDNQVPLNIENSELMMRVARSESFVAQISKLVDEHIQTAPKGGWENMRASLPKAPLVQIPAGETHA